MPQPEGMISVQEAAQRLGRSTEQVRRYLREGKLRGQRIGQQWFIDEKSLSEGPLVYQPGKPHTVQIREAVAAMEIDSKVADIEAVIKSIEAGRAAIRARIGGDVDVVEMVRLDREQH